MQISAHGFIFFYLWRSRNFLHLLGWKEGGLSNCKRSCNVHLLKIVGHWDFLRLKEIFFHYIPENIHKLIHVEVIKAG